MTMPPDPWLLPAWAGDLSEIITAVLSVLRVDPADVDAARMENLAAAAVRRLDSYLDPAEGTGQPFPAPPELFDAAVQTTVRLYKAKDAPYGAAGGWSDYDLQTPIPSDILSGIRNLIVPLKSQFGVG